MSQNDVMSAEEKENKFEHFTDEIALLDEFDNPGTSLNSKKPCQLTDDDETMKQLPKKHCTPGKTCPAGLAAPCKSCWTGTVCRGNLSG